jgi:hypothetical protein
MDFSVEYTILASILSILILTTVVAISKWRELIQERKLREVVAWSAIGECCPTLGRNSYTSDLYIAIHNAQFNEAIDKKYRFAEGEKQHILEIIDAYQKDIMRSYFKGSLRLIESKYVVSGEAYFMAAMYSFLSEHECDYTFLGHDMHKERVFYKSYGESFSSGSESIYSLTDFALTFHKMHYITYMYCKHNKILESYVPEWNEKSIREIIDTQQIQISHRRM